MPQEAANEEELEAAREGTKKSEEKKLKAPWPRGR